jgi:hypothetical protein
MDSELWARYVAYWNRRYSDLVKGVPATKPPLVPEAYEDMSRLFARGLEHERKVTGILMAEMTKPQAEREFLRGMTEPQVDTHLGVSKKGIAGARYQDVRYADQFVVDLVSLETNSPRVEAFSCKSRGFEGLSDNETRALVEVDIDELLAKYGGTVKVRRPGHPLFEFEVEVTKAHLVYDAKLVPKNLRELLIDTARRRGVEVHFR